MGITDWQRRLLEALTNLETGQVETNRRLGETNERLANVEQRLVGVESAVDRLGHRFDHALTTIGEPVRELRERVERLERAVFSPGNPE